MANTPDYEIGKIVKASEVPKTRNKSDKYNSIVAAVNNLAPGQTLVITTNEKKKASYARNMVRDRINKSMGEKIIKTRLVQRQDGTFAIYFTRLFQSKTD